MIPRFANGDLIPNEELDIYPQTQDIILASLSPEVRAREEAEAARLKRLRQEEATKQEKTAEEDWRVEQAAH